jgi:hypothetical protein
VTCMRQRMETYIVIGEVPGHRLIIPNTILLLLRKHLQLQRVMLPVLIPGLVDQRLQVKCPVLPTTGREVVPAQVPGEVVVECQEVEVVGVEVAGVEEVEVVLVEEEDNMFKKENALQCIQNKC